MTHSLNAPEKEKKKKKGEYSPAHHASTNIAPFDNNCLNTNKPFWAFIGLPISKDKDNILTSMKTNPKWIQTTNPWKCSKN